VANCWSHNIIVFADKFMLVKKLQRQRYQWRFCYCVTALQTACGERRNPKSLAHESFAFSDNKNVIAFLQKWISSSRIVGFLGSVSYLGAFGNLQKATITFVMSVHSHATTRLSLDGFSRNLMVAYFSKIWQVKIHFHWNLNKNSPKYIYDHISLISP
jgi:hypothetical protein